MSTSSVMDTSAGAKRRNRSWPDALKREIVAASFAQDKVSSNKLVVAGTRTFSAAPKTISIRGDGHIESELLQFEELDEI